MGMFELGAFTQEEPPKESKRVRFNLDTGAAQTAIPVEWKGHIPTKEGTQMMFKTVSGELVPGTGTGTFAGRSEAGSKCTVTGPLAPVHKPLVSAYKCLKGLLFLTNMVESWFQQTQRWARRFKICSVSPVKPKRRRGCPCIKRKECTTSIWSRIRVLRRRRSGQDNCSGR